MYVVLLERYEDGTEDLSDDTIWDVYGPFVEQDDAERWSAWAIDDPDSGAITVDVRPLRAPARRDQDHAHS